ncbi:relaxase/mobilization nuclease domain-containing protein [Flagellimonas okinawensis]|uniref:Relaxase/mobilization nuclease domain-containing protein n=1 Tax=Flagellimonas okinawensis TaxID=3031324 RepID=A0ABT5XPD2_9FLAO|nr:relaxase/mobilization nuclease domain-containing protein [[Muricauda] okinawensis]MDF0707760.1 relaxase/mobilization nuclease domain-containing protein [[Muricauda] okinawensis]
MGKSISHTAASMSYGMNEEKESEIIHSQFLAGETPQEITEEFRVIQEQNELCKKNTLSFVLSPTIEDGKKLEAQQLKEMTERFLKEMKLREHQAVAFVHRDKEHLHVHLYANRISFEGKAYNDSFIGKRSQQMAERVARQLELTTVREAQQEKLYRMQELRSQIQRIHEKVMVQDRPRDFDQYIKSMEEHKVKVVPSINRQNQLQGFRFEYKGTNLKGSEVHRSMSMGRIATQMNFEKDMVQRIAKEKNMQLLGRTVNVPISLTKTITKKSIKLAIKVVRDTGIGI